MAVKDPTRCGAASAGTAILGGLAGLVFGPVGGIVGFRGGALAGYGTAGACADKEGQQGGADGGTDGGAGGASGGGEGSSGTQIRINPGIALGTWVLVFAGALLSSPQFIH